MGFDGHHGWVYYLAVAPCHRRQGIASDLIKAAENWLRDRDAPKIQLMVQDDNEEAVSFYRAIGYEQQSVSVFGKRIDSTD